MTNSRLILPDYCRPAAIMVPHYDCNLVQTLEAVAARLSHYIGVILLSTDREYTSEFIAQQKYPERFSIITASLDSPWIRDRSPIAVQENSKVVWCIPQMNTPERPFDTTLFENISANRHEFTPLKSMPQGNLVPASDGLVFACNELLSENEINSDELDMTNSALGINEWIIFKGFNQEYTGHADIHIRALRDNLYAVAWNRSNKRDRETIGLLEQQIKQTASGADIIRIPIRSKRSMYASLLNWIQVDDHLIIPKFDLTPEKDIDETTSLLESYGFSTDFIHSPTQKLHGSFHCLTASIFV